MAFKMDWNIQLEEACKTQSKYRELWENNKIWNKQGKQVIHTIQHNSINFLLLVSWKTLKHHEMVHGKHLYTSLPLQTLLGQMQHDFQQQYFDLVKNDWDLLPTL